MQGYVLLKKSQAAWDERDGLRMLTLAQAVRRGPWRLPPKVLAEAAQQEARGHAMLGGDLALIEHKLDDARQLLDFHDPRAGEHETSSFGSHYGSSLLAMQTAICYTEAGASQRAVKIYQDQLREDAFSRRDYGYFLALMGGALAAAGEPEEASRAGLKALSLAAPTDSTRTMHEISCLSDQLELWSTNPAVRDLRTALSL